LFLSDEEAGDTISNLKLQKLLYYAQGLHLAKYGRPLFAEKIKAWKHGPVIPQVYHHFKEQGNASLPKPDECPRLSASVRELLEAVYRSYGQYSAWKLRSFTHEEPPWKNTEQPKEISRAALTAYFKTQLA
jgi:uncharacterized phage-associated protein